MGKIKLGDVIDIKHGFPFEGKYIVPDDNGTVLVTPGNFKIGGGFKEEKCKFFTGSIPDSYILNAGDYIVTMTDLSKTIDTLGYSAKIPFNAERKYLHNQRIGLLIFKKENISKDYIYYIMQTDNYQKYIANTSSGSTVHHTSPSKIYNYEFELPDFKIQNKISKCLSAYDDLIENNQKQIKLLEEAAQRLFKEWFVDLRFPGYKDVKVVDGVPDGWTKGLLDDIAEFSGKNELKENRGNYSYYLPIDCLPKKSLAYNTIHSVNLAESSLVAFKPNDILLGAMRPYFHKVVIARSNGLTRSTCFVINSKKYDYWGYLVMLLFSEDTINYATIISVGTTMPYVRWKDFIKMPIMIPTKDIALEFNKLVSPISKSIIKLAEKNIKLREARDLLLPKLMRGEIKLE